MVQIVTGIVLVLAVAVALLLTRITQKWSKRPEGTKFEIECPYCHQEVEVELRLEASEVGIEEEIVG